MNRLGMTALGVLVLSLVVAPPASAADYVPCRSGLMTWLNGVENVTMAPIDVAVAPVVAVRTVQRNTEDAGMGPFGKSVMMVVGTPWIWTLQNVLTGARIVSGMGEFLIGPPLTVVSCFTDVQERQLFDATTASPMVSHQGGFDVVFGAHYIASH